MSNPDRILQVLDEGPSTSGEVACELRVNDGDATAYIYALPEHRSALAH